MAAELNGNRNAQASAKLQIGNAYLGLGDTDRALAQFQEASDLFNTLNDLPGQVQSLAQLGLAHATQENFDEAIATYQQTLALIQASGNYPDGEISILLQLAHLTYFVEQIDETISAYQRILSIYEQQGDSISEAGVWMDLGDVYLEQENYREAQNAFRNASGLYKVEEARVADYIVSLLKLGEVYLISEQYDLALDISKSALELIERVEKLADEQRPEGLEDDVISRLKSQAHANIGQAYLGQEQYDQAFTSLRTASNELSEISDEVDRFIGRFPQDIRFLSGIFSLTSLIFPGSSLITNIASSLVGADQALTVLQAYYQVPATVVNLFSASEATGQFSNAVNEFEKLLEIAQENNDQEAEANAHLGLGKAQLALQDYDEAIDSFERALEIFQDLGTSAEQEIEALLGLGEAEYSQGESSQALIYTQQSIEVIQYLSNPDPEKEAKALLLLGNIYFALSDYDQATQVANDAIAILSQLEGDHRLSIADAWLILSSISLIQQNYTDSREEASEAFALFEQVGDPTGEANSLLLLSESFLNLGRYDDALNNARRAMLFFAQAGDREGEARALNAIGSALYGQRRFRQAVESFNLSFNIQEQIAPIRRREGLLSPIIDLLGWGLVFIDSLLPSDLDRFVFRLEQGLFLARAFVDVSEGVASQLGLGNVYLSQGEYEQAEDAYEEMQDIANAQGDRAAEADALLGLSNTYLSFERNIDDAQEDAEDALVIYQEIGDRNGEAFALVALSQSYVYLAQAEQDGSEEQIELYQGATENLIQAIAIFRDLDNAYGEALSFSVLGDVERFQDRISSAITFYKESINKIEAIRRDNQGLPIELQQSYASTVADDYRILADLLLSQGRVIEAQQVLDLLKLEEIREFTRTQERLGSSSSSSSSSSILLNSVEGNILEDINALIVFGRQLISCEQTQCSQLEEYRQQRRQLFAQFNEQIDRHEQDIRERLSVDDAFYDPRNLHETARDIVSQPNTLLIYPFVTEDQLWLLYSAAGDVAGVFPVEVGQEELGNAVVHFRWLLGSRFSNVDDLHATAQQLYDWLIAPLEPAILDNEITTLVFSQDRITRYIPMAVLWDDGEYLVERYTLSTILSAELTDTEDRLAPNTNDNIVTAFGLSAQILDFNALPNVEAELDVVVRETDTDELGIFPGRQFLNDTFNRNTFGENISGSRIVHIATHGEFVANSPTESYLLFGDGQPFSIPNINEFGSDLSDVHLVVLSACETAVGGPTADGIEVAGISSYFLTANRASAVLASLWQVNDASTSLLMQEFYTNLSYGTTKAEALRQAQLTFLNEEISIEQIELLRRSNNIVGWGSNGTEEDMQVPVSPDFLSHPYFWAPFILIGNSQ